jgi:hypothetical protein
MFHPCKRPVRTVADVKRNAGIAWAATAGFEALSAYNVLSGHEPVLQCLNAGTRLFRNVLEENLWCQSN